MDAFLVQESLCGTKGLAANDNEFLIYFHTFDAGSETSRRQLLRIHAPCDSTKGSLDDKEPPSRGKFSPSLTPRERGEEGKGAGRSGEVKRDKCGMQL